MLKIGYIITLLSGIGLFNSCTGTFLNIPEVQNKFIYLERKESIYGNYLAGRVAHLRRDYDNASKYYIKSLEKGLVNPDILGKTYSILASKGDIENAVKYANIAKADDKDKSFVDTLNAVYEFKKGNYGFSRSILANVKEKTYTKLITPLFNAWAYTGEGKYDEAIKSLEVLNNNETITVYNLHAGLISEYFDFSDKAEKYYNYIIKNNANDISFRALQIISNFMVRNNQKDDAISLINKYYGATNLKEMLTSLSNKVKQSNITTPKLVKTPEMGAGEVFLEIALLFKSIPSGYEYAQLYMSFSEYFNPNNDVAKIAMADIFEERYMLKEANKYYDSIKKDSEMYYPAQIKKANNLMTDESYKEAIVVLKKLLKQYPNNFQILFNLGDALRVSDNQEEAIKYYNEAIDSIFYESEKYWPVFYAIAISYDKNKNWIKAEQNLEKALTLSNRHPQVLNYLGYSWLKNNTNIDKAVSFIIEAFEKAPNDGVIMDSLGWVYFKTGDYKNAITFLERASELNPQNAIISDHLGDAYWLGGRKNEAIFLWKQALSQKEDSEELNKKSIKLKIKNGIKHTNIHSLKDEKIKEALLQINNVTQ